MPLRDYEYIGKDPVELAKFYQNFWLSARTGCEESIVRRAEEEAVNRFVRCLEAREDTGADLAAAWQYLLNRVCLEERCTDWGLLEAGLVCDTHRELFRTMLFPPGNTPPGRVSDRPRYVDVTGRKRHWYPTPSDMNAALITLLDAYNTRYESHRGAYDLTLFRTCAWFFCRFPALHPFGDGNGRLCHILCSYAMAEYQPFPMPVCEEDDYLTLLLEAQATRDIDPLVTCVACSTCRAWEWFFRALQISPLSNDNRRPH